MLGFDLMDSQAGKDIYDMGQAIGLQKGIKEMLIDALDARFGLISTDMVDQINTINDLEWLKGLHREAMRFKKRLLSVIINNVVEKPDRFWKPVRFDSAYREIISCTFLNNCSVFP